MRGPRGILPLVVFCMAIALPVAAQEITGEVVEVDGSGDFITISIPSDMLPRVGDLAAIQQEVPGVGAVALKGEWEITAVEETTARAVANDEAVRPQVGQTAVISSARPRSRSQVVLDNQLHAAADSDDAAAVREALRAGAELDVRGLMGSTPLMRAASSGSMEALRVLLEAGADTGLEARGGQSPLGVAASAGHTEAVATLIAAGADVDARITSPHAPERMRGATPLIIAADHGRGDVVRALVRGGADITATDEAGLSPLMTAAAASNNSDAVRALLAAGADPNVARADGATALMAAASQGSEVSVAILLRAGAEIDSRLGDSARDEYRGMTPLLLAAYAGEEESVLFLLAAGADTSAVNAAGLSAMDLARTEGREEVIEVLNNPGRAVADTQAYLADELESALLFGYSEDADALLAAGADPNRPDEEGQSPLTQALSSGEEESDVLAMVRALLGAGARINDGDDEAGLTPLMAAAAFAGTSVVNLLLQQGALVNAQSVGMSSSSDGVEPGTTALMVAAGWGNEDVVILLLGSGADPSMTDRSGRTAAEYARTEGNDAIAELLERSGSR